MAQLLIEPLSMAFVQSCGKESCSPLQALTPSHLQVIEPAYSQLAQDNLDGYTYFMFGDGQGS